MSLGLVICSVCGKKYFKDQRHINENIKLRNNFYCSRKCQHQSRSRQITVLCENPICNKLFKRTPSQIFFHNFCSQTCYGVFVGKHNHLRLKEPRYCKYCGKRLYDTKLYCSIRCWSNNHKIPSSQLVEELRTLARTLGHSPTRREYKRVAQCTRFFGSWNCALIEAGLKPHRSLNQRMYKRQVCRANDGHKCFSISELMIDNWLQANDINHIKEAPYPKGKFTVDWQINPTTFVEYFGLSQDSRRYDNTIVQKRIICTDFGIKLIEIYPKDLFPVNNLKKILGNL